MASLLLVEDDDDTTNLMRRWLVQAGHEVVSVVDGEAALKLVNAGAYDLVVLDVQLPGIDGFEVARRLGTPTAQRVLICTVSEREDAPEDLRDTKWLIKPFGRADFLTAIADALAGHA